MMKVKVYWNLHVGGWSVTPRSSGGRVMMDLRQTDLVLLNPVAKFGQGKYHDCHVKGKRHVCAWIIGDMVEASDYNVITDRALVYNPFNNRHFTDQATGEEIAFNKSLGSIATFTQVDGKPVLRTGK